MSQPSDCVMLITSGSVIVPITIYTYSPPADAAAVLQFTVVAKQVAGDATAAWVLAAHVVNREGVCEVLHIETLSEHRTAGAASWDLAIVAVGDEIRVNVTGDNTDIKWLLSRMLTTEVDTEPASYSAEATQYLNRLTTSPPDTARAGLIANLVDSLVASGVWAVLDNLYITGASEADSLQNVVADAHHASRYSVDPMNPIIAFTPDHGWTRTGGVGTLDMVHSDINYGGHFSQNSCSSFTFNQGASPTNTNDASFDSGGYLQLFGYTSLGTNDAIGRIYTNTGAINVSNMTDANGCYLITRQNATSQRFDKNGVTIGSNTTPSQSFSNPVYMRVCLNPARRLLAYGTGGYITPAQSAALSAALNTYFTAIGATGYSAEAQQFFDRLATQPAVSRKALYATLIDSLVAAGVWEHLDQLFVAASDESTMLTNLVNASNYASRNEPTAPTDVMTFTPDRGFRGPQGGLTPNITANYAAGGNWSQDSASWFGWVIGDGLPAVVSSALVNGVGLPNQLLAGAYGPTNLSSCRINGTADTLTLTDTSPGLGLYLVTRTGPTTVRYDKNGVTLGTNAAASVPPTNTGFQCGYSHDRPLSAFGTGGGLDATKSAALHAALQAYLTAIGAV